MRKITHLLKFKEVLENPKACFFPRSFMQPTVRGKFKGYNAEYGLTYQMESGVEIFYRLAMKKPLNIPFALWDKCPVSDSNKKLTNVHIGFRKWVTMTSHTSYYNFRWAEKYFAKKSCKAIEKKFEKLVEVAAQIENGTLSIDKAISKEQKDLVQGLIVVAILIPIIFIAAYFYIYS